MTNFPQDPAEPLRSRRLLLPLGKDRPTRRSKLLRSSAPPLVFLALLGVFGLLNQDSAPPAEPAVRSDLAVPSGDTEALVTSLQAAVAAAPTDADASAQLGNAFYQRTRETGDAAFYTRAEQAYEQALANDPDNVAAITGQATLALARHDFADGLALAQRAHKLEPEVLAPYPAIIDGQIELGRYQAAAQTTNRLLSLKPNLASYARASYLSELNGDLPGAMEAMRLAVSAGAGSSESESYVQTLLGKLQIDRGSYGAAERSYRIALSADPSYVPAQAGLARVLAADGNFDAAIARYQRVVEQLPLPQYAIELGETQEAAGRTAAAERSYALVGVQAKLLASGGVNSDVELAIFEADHGDPVEAVKLGRAGWKAAPGVRSADAYSWALHEAGRSGAAERMAAEAMKLGSRDPSFLFHAGMIARASGDTDEARRLLGRLVAQSPRYNPLYGPEAKRALERL